MYQLGICGRTGPPKCRLHSYGGYDLGSRSRYAIGETPRPGHWSGFRIKPAQIEFWHDRPFRKHDRIVFSRKDISRNEWDKTRLFP